MIAEEVQNMYILSDTIDSSLLTFIGRQRLFNYNHPWLCDKYQSIWIHLGMETMMNSGIIFPLFFTYAISKWHLP